MNSTLPLKRHPIDAHFQPDAAAPTLAAAVIAGKSVHVAEVDDYDLHRSMLYALGAKGVSNKMMAHVEIVVHGRAKPPQKALAKYPDRTFVRAQEVLQLFHQEVPSFAAYVRALQGHGFTIRNPSDEGDPDLDFFELPVVDGSLHATLLDYLGRAPFIRKFVHAQHFPVDPCQDPFIAFEVPESGVTWYYCWAHDGWGRVGAQRGDGDYPLEIKADQLMRVDALFWTESAGMYFYEYPNRDSVDGLFIHAGVDARSGLVHGAAISRVWT
ncbi:hypothetical protein [Nannocystis radixulma]|uniref:Uncharacterized protein n=1 Tax=Nannocystis radixulma TaxID=2995305 RepID=A0ABT5B6Q4_9BACT|nr:hypothetical protein [Nannocystis radixulma]MDC0668706.1 hypothetical protein [Nannocystis radixulma]